MKIKFLRKSEVEFIIQEDKGIVIAKIKNPVGIVIDTHMKLLDIVESNNDYLLMPNIERVEKIRGIAKCVPEDKFDIETGKKIAFAKLQRKYFNIIIDTVRLTIVKAQEAAFVLEKFQYYLFDCVDKFTDKIEDFGA